MAWRIVGGIVGWVASLAPLVIVNLLAFTTAIDPGMIPLAGGAALILSVTLGGLLAGLLGGKRGATWGGTLAGAITAILFAATLIALMYDLRARGQLPYLLALHPIRAMGAIGFVACLIMGAAALVGGLSGRRRARLAARVWSQSARTPVASSGRPSQPRAYRAPSQPTGTPSGGYGAPEPRDGSGRSGQRPPSQSAPRDRGESYSRERTPRW